MDRFRRTMPDVIDRVRFLPRQDSAGYLSLTAAFDAMLDTVHFGGDGDIGYETLGPRVPIIPLPAPFLRGRIAQARYKMMGIEGPIASAPDEYVAKAVKLGTDPDARQPASELTLAANDVLYENAQTVRGLEGFFKQAVARRP